MKVVVLAGGLSSERDVSLASGVMIYRALRQKGHQAILLDVYLGCEEAEGDLFSRTDIDWTAGFTGIGVDHPDIEQVKRARQDGGAAYFGPNVVRLCKEADAVFLGLHGADGEDGKVQAALSLMGVRHTGTDYVSSAIAMDKQLAKELMAYHGIPVPEGFLLRKDGPSDAGDPEACAHPPLPCVVKANRGGSSLGVSIARNREEYEKAVEMAFRYDTEAVVEQYIKGREFSCAVVAGRALPVIEIAPLSGFYDYKNKYQAGCTVETCPADIPPETTERIKRLAEQVFAALRLKKYARMDFMMDESGAVYCLEANTLPGMTPTSLIPQEAVAAGIDFKELCEWILQLAFEDQGYPPAGA